MPKMKSNRGAAKRFKVTARGKIRHKKSNLSHLLEGKNRKRKRRLKKKNTVKSSDRKAIQRLLPKR